MAIFGILLFFLLLIASPFAPLISMSPLVFVGFGFLVMIFGIVGQMLFEAPSNR